MNIFFQGSQGGGWLGGKISNIEYPASLLVGRGRGGGVC